MDVASLRIFFSSPQIQAAPASEEYLKIFTSRNSAFSQLPVFFQQRGKELDRILSTVFVGKDLDLLDIMTSLCAVDEISPHLRPLVQEGLQIMAKSKDSFHDLGHICRVIALSKLYVQYSHQKEVDWGLLLVALVWHDLSRANHPGLFYENRILRFIEHFPLAIEMSLIRNGIKDAGWSFDLLKKFAPSLSEDELQKIKEGIDGSIPKTTMKTAARHSMYYKILCDVDILDLYTPARLDSAIKGVFLQGQLSKKFLRRAIIMGFLMKDDYRTTCLQLPESTPLLDFFYQATLAYVQHFYPQLVVHLSSLGVKPLGKNC